MLTYGATAGDGSKAHLFLGSGTFELLNGLSYGVWYSDTLGLNMLSSTTINLSSNTIMGGTSSLHAGNSTPANQSNWYSTVGSQITPNGEIKTANTNLSLYLSRATGTTGQMAAFFAGTNAAIGSISYTAGGTSFNTTSDYRVKENILSITDSVEKLLQLRPVTYNYLTHPGVFTTGFIAHELQEVIPEAVAGEKDAVDGDGNPDYQGVDLSRVVPVLTAALQETIETVATLSDRLSALENN
jgi:hypothetical protein